MNFFYTIYFWLPNFSRIGMPGKAINLILIRILKNIFDFFVPPYFIKTQEQVGFGLNTTERDEQYIVSLTSFPARLDYIWITIETILRQSFKPDMIILWLDEKKLSGNSLPESLLKLEKRGLTIAFCDDIRSHTKYYYAIKKYPKANIITFDDDNYYPKDALKRLVNLHLKYPNSICANRAHKMVFKKNKIAPYRKWKHNFKGIKIPSHQLVQTGVSGVLYPPNALHLEVFDQTVFKDSCYFADDLWLKVHAFRQNTKIVVSNYFNKDLVAVSKTQNENLVSQNVFDGGNDKQLNDIVKFYNVEINKLHE